MTMLVDREPISIISVVLAMPVVSARAMLMPSTSRAIRFNPAWEKIFLYFWMCSFGMETNSTCWTLLPLASVCSPSLTQSIATAEIGKGIYCFAWNCIVLEVSFSDIIGISKSVTNAEKAGTAATTSLVETPLFFSIIFNNFEVASSCTFSVLVWMASFRRSRWP